MSQVHLRGVSILSAFIAANAWALSAAAAPPSSPAPAAPESERAASAPAPALSTADAAPPTPPESSAAPDPQREVVPSRDKERTQSLEPKASKPLAVGRTTFDIDPVADSAMIAVSLGFAGTLELINSTGEIRPQQIASNFNRSQLFWLDRGAITQHVDAKASSYSTLGLGAAVAFAVLDPILSGIREKSVQTGVADAFMYGEAVSFSLAMTNLVKMAVRRPRPAAYIEAEKNPGADNGSTDSALSFFSGHAAITATIGATATYLAFKRSPHTARPWVTLIVAAAATTFVSVERVRAGRHFPSDVIAGSIAGAGIGLVVPHLHRTDDIKQRRIWVGFAPMDQREGARGGMLNVSGIF